MLEKNINSPRTSSIGRLFDAVASLLDIQHINHYEGQAPMQLEFVAWQADANEQSYPFKLCTLQDQAISILNWQQLILQIIQDIKSNVERSIIAAKFHNTVIEFILKIAQQAKQQKIVLSGGSFQNKYLVEKSLKKLSAKGFKVYTHQQVPPNDGGIALGQIAALHYLNNKL